MDMLGKTLATAGAAWLCLLFALVVFDYVQDAFSDQTNLLFAGWTLIDTSPCWLYRGWCSSLSAPKSQTSFRDKNKGGGKGPVEFTNGKRPGVRLIG
jgi:hypothetical protein